MTCTITVEYGRRIIAADAVFEVSTIPKGTEYLENESACTWIIESASKPQVLLLFPVINKVGLGPKAIPLSEMNTNMESVSYTHLDVYKRQM